MFCPNCGANQADGARFCQNCGAPMIYSAGVQAPQPTYVAVRQKVPGRGMGIAAIVLGIVGVFYGFVMAIAASALSDIDRVASNMRPNVDVRVSSAFVVPIIMLASLSIMALAFGSSAVKKGYKNGISTSGIVLGIIGIALYVIALILNVNA